MQQIITPRNVDISLSLTMGDYEIDYVTDGKPRWKKYSDTQLVKLLKAHDFISGHRYYNNAYKVMGDYFDTCSLEDFLTCYCNMNLLVAKIEGQ